MRFVRAVVAVAIVVMRIVMGVVVRVMAVTMDNRPFKRVYEPGNPDANAEGYVMYPDINVVEEMANLMTAQRNYEANVTTVDAVKGMYVKALEIGK